MTTTAAVTQKGRRTMAGDAAGQPSFGRRNRRDTLYGFLPTTLPDAKQVFVHVNGDSHEAASSFVVHPRRIRTYEMFLNDLTDKMRPGFGAVRNVYTPVNGSRVRDLEDLENHQRYVIAGHEPFRKLRYADIDIIEAKRRTNRNSAKPPPRETGRISKSNRRRPYGWEPVHIFIYQNGDDVTPPVRISTRRAELDNWEHLMLRIGDKLDKSGFVKRLYNLNGDWVRGPKGIKNGQYYVAVGGYDSFKQVMYGKLLDRLPQEFLSESTKKTRPRPRAKANTKTNATKTSNANPPRKIPPKIKAPPSVYRKVKPKVTISNDNSNGNKGEKAGTIKKNPETVVPSRKVRKAPVKSKLAKIVEEPITNKRPVIASKPPQPPPPSHIAGSKLAQINKRNDPIVARQQPRRKEPSTVNENKIRNLPHKIGGGGVVVIKSATVDDGARQGKSPPDSDDSAYMSENEKRDRRNGRLRTNDAAARPKSFRLIEDRPLPPPNTNDIYHAPPTDNKKQSQKRVTLVDYDQDVGGVYRARPIRYETESQADEVQELENVPVELPIDEVEAEEVGEYSEDEEEYGNDTNGGYYKRTEGQHQNRYHSVAHSEANLRSSATTVS